MGESGATHYKAQRRRQAPPWQRVAAARPDPAPLHVRNVRIDSGSDGQRLDNFLAKILKGVPRTHLYRVIRSGEVRVNKGRAAADTRLGARRRGPHPADARRRSRDRPEAPGREFAVVHEDESSARDRQARGRRRARRQRRELRRDRAAAPRPRPGEFLELVHRLDKETSGLLLSPRPGRRWSRCRTTCARASPGARLRQDLRGAGRRRLAGKAQGDRRRPAQGPAERRQPARPRRRRRRRARPALDHAGARRAPLRRLQPARRDAQDRPHAPDPRPPADAGHAIAGDPKYGDFALNRALARGTLVPGCRFERMFLHARRLRFVHLETGVDARARGSLPAECTRLLEVFEAGRDRARTADDRGTFLRDGVGHRPRSPSSGCPPTANDVEPRPASSAPLATLDSLEGTSYEHQATHSRRRDRRRARLHHRLLDDDDLDADRQRSRPDGQAPGDRCQRRRRLGAPLRAGPVVARADRQGARRPRVPVDRLGRPRRRRLVRTGRAARTRAAPPRKY